MLGIAQEDLCGPLSWDWANQPTDFKESKEEMMLILKSVPTGEIGRREVLRRTTKFSR
jgi:hypothetical protein